MPCPYWYHCSMTGLWYTGVRRAVATAVAALGVLLLASTGARAQGVVLELELDGPLGVATAEYIIT